MTGADVLARLVPALVVVVGIPVGIWWFARRGTGGAATPLRVVARTGVGHRASVAVVEVAARRFLVGATDHNVRLLTEIEHLPDSAAADPASPRKDTDADRPRMGPIRHLQQMTLRRAEPVRRRPRRAGP